MTLHTLAVRAILAVDNPSIDDGAAGKRIKGILLLVFGLACVAAAIRTAWKHHPQGEMKKAAQSLGVLVICFAMAALGVTAGLGLLWGQAILSWAQTVVG